MEGQGGMLSRRKYETNVSKTIHRLDLHVFTSNAHMLTSASTLVKEKLRDKCMEDQTFQYLIFSLDDYNIYCYVCTFILEFAVSLEFVLLYKCNERKHMNKLAPGREEARIVSSDFCSASGW